MVMIGSGHRVLLTGGEGVVLYAPTARGMQRETAISWDVPNFEQVLADTLAGSNQRKSVLVLFDGADQTYKRETIGQKMSFIDRPRFVKRKLELTYPSYPIRAAQEIKPPKNTKRGQHKPSYLFVALPEIEQLDRIGNALFESGVPVSGFGLLPMESSGLVTELAEKSFGKAEGRSRWSVLIGQHETGGLRQVVVKDGNLALTRLTPTSDAGASGPGWVEEAAREFRATLTYISRFGYSSDDALDVMIICGDIEKQFFDPKTMPTARFKCLNPSEALRTIGIKSAGLEKSNFADAVHASWAGRKGKLALPMVVPSIQRIRAPRQHVRIASVALGLSAASICYLALQGYWSYSQLKSEIGEKQNQRTMLQREYDEEAKVFEGLPVKPETVQAAMDVKESLEKETINLRPLLHKLKDTLGNEIHLQELTVEHTPTAALTGTQPGVFAPAGSPEDRGKVKMTFKFTLPDAMALEQKVTRAEQLAVTLRSVFPNYNVSIVSQFGKVQRGGKFTGDAGNTQAQVGGAPDVAEFQLEGAPL